MQIFVGLVVWWAITNEKEVKRVWSENSRYFSIKVKRLRMASGLCTVVIKYSFYKDHELKIPERIYTSKKQTTLKK